ncbi:MAG: carboxymuconolactone decarboxylase family protein [Deltaproteobacteria bacterium]|nr:carboxymuconolactone decarboxylase family protein [Deltaproteobacteria bacterium]
MDIKTIDPALDLLKVFGKLAKGTTVDIERMRQKVIFSDGLIPKKYKTLAAVLWAVSSRCEPCAKYYVAKAKEFGVTEEEIGEALAIASTMGGCVGEMWALKAFKAFKGDTEEGTVDDPSCCTT